MNRFARGLVPGGDLAGVPASDQSFGDLHRLFLLKPEQKTGVITINRAFHDADGKKLALILICQRPGGWKRVGNVEREVLLSRCARQDHKARSELYK